MKYSIHFFLLILFISSCASTKKCNDPSDQRQYRYIKDLSPGNNRYTISILDDSSFKLSIYKIKWKPKSKQADLYFSSNLTDTSQMKNSILFIEKDSISFYNLLVKNKGVYTILIKSNDTFFSANSSSPINLIFSLSNRNQMVCKLYNQKYYEVKKARERYFNKAKRFPLFYKGCHYYYF